MWLPLRWTSRSCPKLLHGTATPFLKLSCVLSVYHVWSLCAARDEMKIRSVMLIEHFSESVIVLVKHLSVAQSTPKCFEQLRKTST